MARPLIIITFLFCIATLGFSQEATWDNYTGNWSDDASWQSGVNPGIINLASPVTINGHIRCESDLQFADSSLTINDTLYIFGSLTLNDSVRLLVNPGGVLIVRGDLVCGDSVQVDLQGTMVVAGSFTLNGSDTTGSFTISGGALYVFDAAPAIPAGGLFTQLACADPLDYPANCGYGNLANLEASTIASFYRSADFGLSLPEGITFCMGDSVSLRTNSLGSNFQWLLDGTPVAGANDTIIWAKTAGYYKFLRDINGYNLLSDSFEITAFALPVVNLGTDTANCDGTTITLDAGAGFASYLWSTTGTSQTENIGAVGSADYSVTVTDANNCQGVSDTVSVTIHPRPVVNLGSDTANCEGTTITLDAGPGYANYSWSSGEASQTIAISAIGSNSYDVTVTDVNNCTAASNSVNVTIHPNPVVDLGTDTANCPGTTITLDAGAGFSDYLWSTAESTSSIDITTSGNYSLTVTDANNCTDRDTIFASFEPFRLYSAGNGNFAAPNRWSTTSGGAGNYTYDASANPAPVFIIENNDNIVVTSAMLASGIVVRGNGRLQVQADITLGCDADTILIADNGQMELYGNYLQAGGSANLFAMTGGELLVMADVPGFLSGFETITLVSGTVNYAALADQTIESLNYYHFATSGTGAKTLTAPIVVAGNLSIGLNTSLSVQADNANIALTGNWTNNGTFLHNDFIHSVIFNNTLADQQISGATRFHTLEMAKTAGTDLLLASPVAVDYNLSFTADGCIATGTNNLILGIGLTSAITQNGSFSANRMIRQNGTIASGRVIKEVDALAGYTFDYPVGTGTLYSPVSLGPLSATVTDTGTIAVNPVPYVSPDNDIITRYFTIETVNISAITEGGVLFYYDDTEEVGTPNLVTRSLGASTVNVPDALADLNSNFFGAGTGNTMLDGDWRFVNAGVLPKTYYSYQSGNFTNPDTWTTDPAGALQTGQPVGGIRSIDHIVILSGRTVTSDIASITLASVTINAGGAFDLAATNGHSFSFVYGQGLLRLSSNQLPVGDFTSFVSNLGGTIEYYDFTGTLSSTFLAYNNIVFSGTGTKSIGAGAPIALNILGSLTISGGSVVLGTSANAVTLTVYGDFTVASGATWNVGNFNTFHTINFYGNFTNEGTVRFTNQAAPNYTAATNTGAVLAVFRGSANNTATFNGTSDFYRLILYKGIDQTYRLDLLASNTTNFRLFGPCNSTANNYTHPSPFALALEYGTLHLVNNIVLPMVNYRTGSLCIYDLLDEAQLWIDGNCTASFGYRLRISGTVRISDNGQLNLPNGSIVMLDASSLIIEDNAVVTTTRLRPAIAGAANRGAFIMRGGTLNIIDQTVQDDFDGNCAVFGVPMPEQVFKMYGGTININYTHQSTQAYGALAIGVSSDNYEVTGGTININTNNRINNVNRNWEYYIASTVPFYNLNINRLNNNGTTGVRIMAINGDLNPSTTFSIPLLPIRVLNDFTITNTLGNATFNANGQDIIVEGNFIVQSGATYTPGTNTTIFSGSTASQTITANAALAFNNLTINNTFAGGSVTLAGTSGVSVAGNLSLTSGTFNDGGKTVTVNGNVSNSAIHTGAGRLQLVGAGAAAQISGSGSGVFANLELNKANGAVFAANQSVTGALTLTQGVLNIGAYNLHLAQNATMVVPAPSSACMLSTNGLYSDAGVSKEYSTTGNSFVFPVGSGGKYTPAQMDVTAGVSGTITLRPVNQQHPLVTIPPATVNDALTYYWRATSTGFSGVTSVTGLFNYDGNDVPGGDGNDVAFVSALYDDGLATWSTQATTNPATNQFTFTPTNIDGEYTAGNIAAFGAVTVFESIVSGDWETPATWRKTQNGVEIENPATTIPTGVTPVVVHTGHTVTVTGSGGAVSSGSLTIESGATLDLGTTITSLDHNFGALVGEGVTGAGTLRISSSADPARFPAGDFGDFLGQGGGAVEYYRTATDFMLPVQSIAPTNFVLNHYNNLIITPENGVLTFPNLALRIYDDLLVQSTSPGSVANLSATANGDLTIDSTLRIAGQAQLVYPNGTARSIEAGGNVEILGSGSFSVSPAGTAVANRLRIGGSLLNQNIFDMNQAGPRYVDTEFFGVTNETIEGAGGTTDFNRLIVNKGTDTTALLDITSSQFSLSATTFGPSKALALQNGTLRLSANHTIVLNSGNNSTKFNIPASTQLWIANGQANVTATGTNAGIFLAGKLRISGTGQVTIFAAGNNDNCLEYSGTGTPELLVESGGLTVGTQLRRLTTTLTGSLRYRQWGGTVSVGTARCSDNDRSVFEVLNGGSLFEMTGGTLTIGRRQEAPTVPAVLVSPASSNVSGGQIVLGDATTPANRDDFTFAASCPLWDVMVSNASATGLVCNLSVNNLNVRNHLEVATGSSLVSNNFYVNIGGNFTALGTYTPGTNLTTFDGTTGNQTISGPAVTLYDMAINNTFVSGTVALADNITVSRNLTITDGVLDDAGRVLRVNGNIANSSQHISSVAGGGILLQGSTPQWLEGSGVGRFGNLALNNSFGAYLSASQQIDQQLTFTRGILNADNLLLTLGNSFSVGGTPSDTALIKTSGSIGDDGVRILIPATPFNYMLPIGVNGKYTPVSYSSVSNVNAGWITVKPVNSPQPLTADPFNRELAYYWQVNSNGLAGTILTQQYTYKDVDVLGRGNENAYGGARYFGGVWNTTGVVLPAANTFTFANVNFIDGDYTAGELSEFGGVPATFTTAQSGPWENTTTWVGGVVPVPNAQVIIDNNHIVTIATPTKRTYSLQINPGAELNIGTTTGHSFGNVSGSGMLTVGTTIFPNGDYSAFTATTGGTVRFINAGYTITNNLTAYNHLIIESAGTLTLPAIPTITIRGNITIASGTLSAAGQRLVVGGNWVNNGTFVRGASTVEYNSSTTQYVSGASVTTFQNIILNKPAENLTLDTVMYVNGLLTFGNGLINSSNTDTLVLTANATYTGYSDQSFVNGPVSKISTGGGFTFPTGKEYIARPITLSNFTGRFHVENYIPAPAVYPIISPLTRVSDQEFFDVRRISGASTPNLTLYWTSGNQLPLTGNISTLRIARRNTAPLQWEETTSSPSLTGNINSGSITIPAIPANGRYTFASTEATPVICSGTEDMLYQAYAVAGATDYQWTTSNAALGTIAEVAVNDRLAHADFSTTTAGSGYFTLQVFIGADAVMTKTFPFTVGPAQPAIVALGATTFCQGGNVVLDAPTGYDGYLWSNGATSEDLTVAVSGTYTVRVVQGSCTSAASNSITVTVNPLPDASLAVSDATIYEGQTATIQVTGSQNGVNYQLRLNSDDTDVGALVAGNGGIISFNVSPLVTTQYNVYATNGTCSVELTDIATVTVLPVPAQAASPTGVSEVCQDAANTLFATTGAAGATSYEWAISPVGSGTVSGTGTTGTVNWNAGFIGTATITVRGVNGAGNGAWSAGLDVEVHATPVVGPVSSGDSLILR